MGKKSIANKKICRHFTNCSGNNKAHSLSSPDNARSTNCIFMVIEGNSRPNNSQSGNTENWKALNNLKWGPENTLQLLSPLFRVTKWHKAGEEANLYSSWVKMGIREGWRTVISTKVLLVFTGSPSSKAMTNNCRTEKKQLMKETQVCKIDHCVSVRTRHSTDLFLSVAAWWRHVWHLNMGRITKQDAASRLH